jgi:hypothetical protein
VRQRILGSEYVVDEDDALVFETLADPPNVIADSDFSVGAQDQEGRPDSDPLQLAEPRVLAPLVDMREHAVGEHA